MGLHQALANGQPEATPETARPVVDAGGLPEQVREPVRWNASASVGNRDRDVSAIAPRGDLDR